MSVSPNSYLEVYLSPPHSSFHTGIRWFLAWTLIQKLHVSATFAHHQAHSSSFILSFEIMISDVDLVGQSRVYLLVWVQARQQHSAFCLLSISIREPLATLSVLQSWSASLHSDRQTYIDMEHILFSLFRSHFILSSTFL